MLSTPKNNETNSGAGTSHKVTPVSVRESPLARRAQKGNLTGNVRLISDHVVDVTNTINLWNQQTIDGAAILRNIIDEKQLRRTAKDDAVSNRMRKLFQSLQVPLTNLAKVVEKLWELTGMLDAVEKLQCAKANRNSPLFLTWPTYKFAQTSRNIAEMYRQEYNWKCRICQLMGTCEDDCTLTLYHVGWLQQPYIEKEATLAMNGMLKEVGHTVTF